MVEDGGCSHETDFVKNLGDSILKGHLNCTTGSKVMTILLNGLILPICGASALEGLQSTWPPSS